MALGREETFRLLRGLWRRELARREFKTVSIRQCILNKLKFHPCIFCDVEELTISVNRKTLTTGDGWPFPETYEGTGNMTFEEPGNCCQEQDSNETDTSYQSGKRESCG